MLVVWLVRRAKLDVDASYFEQLVCKLPTTGAVAWLRPPPLPNLTMVTGRWHAKGATF